MELPLFCDGCGGNTSDIGPKCSGRETDDNNDGFGTNQFVRANLDKDKTVIVKSRHGDLYWGKPNEELIIRLPDILTLIAQATNNR